MDDKLRELIDKTEIDSKKCAEIAAYILVLFRENNISGLEYEHILALLRLEQNILFFQMAEKAFHQQVRGGNNP